MSRFSVLDRAMLGVVDALSWRSPALRRVIRSPQDPDHGQQEDGKRETV